MGARNKDDPEDLPLSWTEVTDVNSALEMASTEQGMVPAIKSMLAMMRIHVNVFIASHTAIDFCERHRTIVLSC